MFLQKMVNVPKPRVSSLWGPQLVQQLGEWADGCPGLELCVCACRYTHLVGEALTEGKDTGARQFLTPELQFALGDIFLSLPSALTALCLTLVAIVPEQANILKINKINWCLGKVQKLGGGEWTFKKTQVQSITGIFSVAEHHIIAHYLFTPSKKSSQPYETRFSPYGPSNHMHFLQISSVGLS